MYIAFNTESVKREYRLFVLLCTLMARAQLDVKLGGMGWMQISLLCKFLVVSNRSYCNNAFHNCNLLYMQRALTHFMIFLNLIYVYIFLISVFNIIKTQYFRITTRSLATTNYFRRLRDIYL